MRPIAAYSASKVTDRKIRLIPLIGDREMRTDYSIAMAVRYPGQSGNKWLRSLFKRQSDINEIIRDYGVPLVMADGSVVIGKKFSELYTIPLN